MEKTQENPTPSGPSDALKKNLDWYIANQKTLAADYNGKVLLIVDQKLVGVFDQMADAYAAAMKSYQPGAFTLQPCSPTPDSYTVMFYTPIFGTLG